ncbi:uncharacterized protein AMSG_07733 [Thecamonas trahens ATCC 50062]|uniref:START domain-containing protein n=1 Tax=Thecamonas trahens ATCC 50062 TaxID=461836 RepID=A0A0L0DHI0_THETB|nr:hypothetical protein AMSG_07733 [Thecamonas trahens ATCC 50062]KNC51670.1 hypothetical protein AMSG_07733 [Thecamonas trahens ATCC 50062]|eukprot:XP_013755805.1 hypothetical protein AMSG_07733 [Thecamonas trahens ATCC 50062]
MAKRTMAKTDRAIRKTVQSLPKKQSKVTMVVLVRVAIVMAYACGLTPPTTPSPTLAAVLIASAVFAIVKAALFDFPMSPHLAALIATFVLAAFAPPLTLVGHILSYTSYLSPVPLAPHLLGVGDDDQRAPLLGSSTRGTINGYASHRLSSSSASSYTSGDEEASGSGSFVSGTSFASCDTEFVSADGTAASFAASSFAGAASPASYFGTPRSDRTWAGEDGLLYATPPEHSYAAAAASARLASPPLPPSSSQGVAEAAGDGVTFGGIDDAPEAHRELLLQTCTALHASLSADAPGWEPFSLGSSVSNGVTLEVKDMPHGVQAARALFSLYAPVDAVIAALSDWTRRAEWDPGFESATRLAELGGGAAAWRLAFHGRELTQQRDACVLSALSAVGPRGSAMLVALVSVERSDCPPRPDYARMTVYPSGFLVEPLPSGATRVAALFASDIEGWVPRAIKRQLTASVALAVVAVCNSLATS